MALDTLHEQSFRRSAVGAEYLSAETEDKLARKWRDQGCEASMHRIVNAHIRLAMSMARKYRRYNANNGDLEQEAMVGLMKAAAKFDPDKEVRFSSYAMFWIKASIQEAVMRNWSLVRVGSTSSQKSLFFNLRRMRAEMESEAAKQHEVLDRDRLHEMIAEQLGVPLRDVAMMDGRMSGNDLSLNVMQSVDDDGPEWIENLEDDADGVEDVVAQANDRRKISEWLCDAMGALNERERSIVMARKLGDDVRTLEDLGGELGLSKERVRQLESGALQKMKTHLVRRLGPRAMELI